METTTTRASAMSNRMKFRPLIPKSQTVLDSHLGGASFRAEIGIFNFTHQRVTITHRNGIAYEVIPQTPTVATHRNRIVIRHALSTTRQVINNMASKLNAPSRVLSDAQRHLMESPNAHGRVNGPFTPCDAVYEYLIDWDQIADGDDHYLPESDICITLKPIVDSAPHPYSKFAEAVASETKPGGLINIRVIDNTESRGRVFMPLHSLVFAIDATQDDTLEDGVYIEYGERCFGESGALVQAKAFYTFDQVEGGKAEFQLYSTKAAAYLALHAERHSELEVLKLKHDSEMAKAQADLVKAKMAKDEIELKVKHFEQEREEAKRKEKAKESLESRSAFRKELLEFVKLVAPTIALVQLIIKLRTGS